MLITILVFLYLVVLVLGIWAVNLSDEDADAASSDDRPPRGQPPFFALLVSVLALSLGGSADARAAFTFNVIGSPDPVPVGASLAYTMRIDTDTDTAAMHVRVAHDATLEYDPGNSSPTCLATGGSGVVCDFGEMAGGSRKTSTVAFVATAAGDATSLFTLNEDDGSGVPGDIVTVAETSRVVPEQGPVSATVEATKPEASEGGNPGEFTVTLDRPAPEGGLTILYSIGGTARPGTDYTPLDGHVAVAAGSRTATIDVSPLDDDAIDGPTTVVVTIQDGNGYVAGQPDTGTVTILDNDKVTVTIEATKPEASEGGDPGEFTVTLDRPAPLGGLTVAYSTGGTARPGVDYEPLEGVVAVAAGFVTATIAVIPVDDDELDGPNTVIVTVEDGDGYVTGSPSQAVVTIADNDKVTATIEATTPETSEGGDPGEFTVTLDRPAPVGGVTVLYATSGTARPGVDYEALSGRAVVEAGAQTATIAVTPLDDDLLDGPVSVDTALLDGDGYVVGSPAAASVVILDNDKVTASIEATKPDTSEGGDPGEFTVTLNRPAPVGGLTVAYAVAGTARPGADYEPLSGHVRFMPGYATATIAVVPLDDTDVDGPATVIVTLDDDPSYVLGSPSEATVTIGDNDRYTATVAATDPDAAEDGDPGVFTITLDHPAGTGGVAVEYTYGGSAELGKDYDAEPAGTSIIVPEGQRGVDILVTPVDDTEVENSETVILTLAPGDGYDAGEPSSATMTLADNDDITVSVAATKPDASEHGDPGEFTIALSAPARAGGLTVGYSIGGTATEGTDYESLGTSVFVEAGATTAALLVIPLDDTVVEGPETVELTLANGSGYVVGTPSAATVTIADRKLALDVVSGDGQLGAPDMALAPFVVKVTSAGTPRPGTMVRWTVDDGDGTLSHSESVTDDDGRARTVLTLGADPRYSVSAVIAGTDITGRFSGLVANLGRIPGLDRNQRNVAKALDDACPALDAKRRNNGLNGPEDDLWRQCLLLIDNQASSSVPQALTALTARDAAAAGTLLTKIGNRQLANITVRMAELRRRTRGISTSGLTLNVEGQSVPGAVLEAALADGLGGAAGDDPTLRFRRPWGVFVAGTVDWGSKDGTTNEEGFDFDTTGLTLGVDYRFSARFAGGAALGYAKSDAKMDNKGKLDVDGWSGSLYGTYYLTGPYYKPSQFYLEGIATYGRNSYDSERKIRYSVASEDVDRTAKGRYDGSVYGVSLGGGYDYNKGGVSAGVYGRFGWIKGDIDGYKEKNADGLDLRFKSQDVKSFTSTLGIKLSKAFNPSPSVTLTPAARAEWVHEFKDDDRTIRAGFVNDPTGGTFGIVTDDPDRDYYRLGTGFDAAFRNGVSAYLDFSGTVDQQDISDYTVIGGVQWSF